MGETHDLLGDLAELAERHRAIVALRPVGGSSWEATLTPEPGQSRAISVRRDTAHAALAALVVTVERYTRPDGVIE